MDKTTNNSISLKTVLALLGLSEFLQAKVIESVVQQRFGDLSLRIFRLLRMKKQLEQKGVRFLDPHTVGVVPRSLSTVARNTCTRARSQIWR